jgi:hypothetical protein
VTQPRLVDFTGSGELERLLGPAAGVFEVGGTCRRSAPPFCTAVHRILRGHSLQFIATLHIKTTAGRCVTPAAPTV